MSKTTVGAVALVLAAAGSAMAQDISTVNGYNVLGVSGATSTAVHGDHSAHMAAAHGTGNATQPLPSVRSVAADHYPAEEHVSGAAGTRVKKP